MFHVTKDDSASPSVYSTPLSGLMDTEPTEHWAPKQRNMYILVHIRDEKSQAKMLCCQMFFFVF